jgi:large subunit ribosomal protein L25
VLYGGDQPAFFFSTRKSIQNLVYTPNAHTVVILVTENHLLLFLKDIQVHPVTDDILHIDFQIFGDKEITIEVPKIGDLELWLVEIYV